MAEAGRLGIGGGGRCGSRCPAPQSHALTPPALSSPSHRPLLTTAPAHRWMLGNEIDDVLDLTFAEETDYFGAPVCPV